MSNIGLYGFPTKQFDVASDDIGSISVPASAPISAGNLVHYVDKGVQPATTNRFCQTRKAAFNIDQTTVLHEAVANPVANGFATCALTNGNTVAVSCDGANVKFAIYNKDGVRQGSITTIEVSASTSIGINVVTLVSGDFVVLYGNTAGYPKFARYNSAGTLQGSLTVIQSVSGSGGIGLVALATGDFVCVFRDSSANALKFARYNASGVLQGSITTIVAATVTKPSAALLTSGNFIVVYYNQDISCLSRIIYSSTGGIVYSITNDTSGNQQFVLLPKTNGEFVVAYVIDTMLNMFTYSSASALIKTCQGNTTNYVYGGCASGGSMYIGCMLSNGDFQIYNAINGSTFTTGLKVASTAGIAMLINNDSLLHIGYRDLATNYTYYTRVKNLGQNGVTIDSAIGTKQLSFELLDTKAASDMTATCVVQTSVNTYATICCQPIGLLVSQNNLFGSTTEPSFLIATNYNPTRVAATRLSDGNIAVCIFSNLPELTVFLYNPTFTTLISTIVVNKGTALTNIDIVAQPGMFAVFSSVTGSLYSRTYTNAGTAIIPFTNYGGCSNNPINAIAIDNGMFAISYLDANSYSILTLLSSAGYSLGNFIIDNTGGVSVNTTLCLLPNGNIVVGVSTNSAAKLYICTQAGGVVSGPITFDASRSYHVAIGWNDNGTFTAYTSRQYHVFAGVHKWDGTVVSAPVWVENNLNSNRFKLLTMAGNRLTFVSSLNGYVVSQYTQKLKPILGLVKNNPNISESALIQCSNANGSTALKTLSFDSGLSLAYDHKSIGGTSGAINGNNVILKGF